jgi:hypothetical protein
MVHTLQFHFPKHPIGAPQRCEVDLHAPPDGYGGFGSVYPVLGQPGFVAKRIEMGLPVPLGDLRTFTVHVTETRTRFEAILNGNPVPFVRRIIGEILESLALGWSVDLTPEGRIAVLWFLQRRAPGRPLRQCFSDEAPPIPVRKRIARAVVGRIRTLRRTDLVHLDCVDDNIFLDLHDNGNIRVTLIDLDGSGVIRRSEADAISPADTWIHKPFTLGHVSTVRVPIWYPQAGIETGPRSGNYLYGERWVVLDTIIRILTWNRYTILSWLEPGLRRALSAGYHTVNKQLSAERSAGEIVDEQAWRLMYNSVLNELLQASGPLPAFVPDHTQPQCLIPFANLAQTAYFDPAELAGDRLSGGVQQSPYETFDHWLR